MMETNSSFPPAGAGGGKSAGSTTDNNIAMMNASSAPGEATMEVVWNPRQECANLQKASRILSDRQLKLAAKWCIEQWMGMQADIVDAYSRSKDSDNEAGVSLLVDADESAKSTIPDDLLFENDRRNPAVCYAKVLMELGEYQHAASTLSQPSLGRAKVERGGCYSCDGGRGMHMPPPLRDLSPFGLYLRAYALYMAGERRREEEGLEMKGGAAGGGGSGVGGGGGSHGADGGGGPSSAGNRYTPSANPYLQQLLNELLDAYKDDKLDPFGLHVYGMVLKQAAAIGKSNNSGSRSRTASLPMSSPSPQMVLMMSLLQFPYNWSCWLDLAECALADRMVEREIEQELQPALAGHFVYHFFCAYLQSEHQAHSEALQLYERWLEPSQFGASPYLLTQYAIIQYHLRDFGDAKRLMEELHEHMPYRLDSMDVYSNILYVQEDAVGLSHLAHTAVQVDKYRPETCVIVGNYYSLKQQRAKAVQYFERAVRIDRNFTSAYTLMGHEYVEWKQTSNAIEAYRNAVHVSPQDFRAWYGLGQTYEFLNMYLYSLYYYKRACQLRPYDARMWCALGTTLGHLHQIPDAIRAYERALQQGDTEGVATQKLAALYKQENQTEKAAQCYLQHLEMRYRITSTTLPPPTVAAAGSAAAGIVQGQLLPVGVSLDDMLLGLVVESTEAEAILYLAQYHKNSQEYETAIKFASRLLEYPGPEKEEAKALLRELRSRTSSSSTSSNRRIIHTRSKGPPPPQQNAFG